MKKLAKFAKAMLWPHGAVNKIITAIRMVAFIISIAIIISGYGDECRIYAVLIAIIVAMSSIEGFFGNIVTYINQT